MTREARGAETQPAAAADLGGMNLFEHLSELRKRLVACILMLLVTALVCFSLAPQLFDFLRVPLDQLETQRLIVLGPLEMFMTYLKLSLLAAVFVSSPWILVQAWLFVAPGLYKNEKRWVIPFVLLGTVFFFGGGSFGFFVVLPIGFEYLVSMVPEGVDAQYSVALYFSFIIRLVLAFGLVFELPLLMWILAAAGIVSPDTFRKLRKYWLVIAAIIGALMTDPSPVTQLLMAVPLVIFFEMGLIGARILYRRQPS